MLQNSIIRTKLLIPQSGEQALPRKRLFQALDEGINKRLCLICAPAGFGKTTLVTSWINTVDHPTVWISLDERDRNLHGFLSYLWEAFRPFIPDTAEVMISGLSGQKTVSAEDNSLRLINALAEMGESLNLVLDDYHMIDNSEIHDFVRLLIHDAPPNLNLIITTRSDPPLQLAKFRAKTDLLEIRSNDLVFNQDEFKDFITGNSTLRFSNDQLQILHEKTEGWITAARLALLSIDSDEDIPTFIQQFGGTDRHIMDYLMEEVLNHLDEEIRTFLYKTSILTRINAALCDHLMGWHASESILEQLEKQNLFIVPLDNQRNWFRYHPLIAQILQHKLKANQGGEVPDLHRNASQWFRAQSIISEAIYHADQAGDSALIAELIRENGGRMLQEARLVELSEWFELLDDDLIRQDSLLSLDLAWTLLLMGQLADARDYTQQAKENPPIDTDLGNIPASIAAIEAYLALFTGDPASAIAEAQTALALYDEDDHSSISVVSFVLGNALALAGKPVEAVAAHDRAIRSAEITGSIHIELPARNARIVLTVLQGAFSEAVHEYEAILTRYSATKSPPPPLATTHIGLADLLLDRLELTDAARHAEMGMEIAKRWGNSEGMIHAEVVMLVVHMVHGKYDLAHESAERVKELLAKRDNQYHRIANVHGVLIQLLLASRGSEAAREYMDENQLGLKGKPSQQRMLEYVSEILVLIAEGHAAEALNEAEQLVKVYEESKNNIYVLILNFLQARAASEMGDQDKAKQYLELAVDLAVKEKLYRFALAYGPTIDQLKLLFPKPSEELSAFLARVELESSATGLIETDDGLVEKLSKREMEVLQLLASGLSNEELAKKMFVSLATIKTHLQHIYAKLDVKNRTSAVEQARKLGLV